MNKKQMFNETKAYEDREKYSIREIYSTCTQSFSNYRTLKKSKEFGLPQERFDKCGIIPKLSVIWYAYNYRLFLYNYDYNNMEEVATFSSKVLFVDIFIPKENIFNSKILYCFLVITETQVIIYGVDRVSNALINTNFVAPVSSNTLCYSTVNGSIYLGCEDGNLYEVIYKSPDSWTFKIMYLYSPSSSYIKNIIPSFLRRKKTRIIAMSASMNFLVTLSREIDVYNISSGIFKIKSISIHKEYVDIQIVEEKHGIIFFYCVLADGSRDFFDTKHLCTKTCFLDNEKIEEQRIKTYDRKLLVIHKNRYQGSLIHLFSLNEFQIYNIDRNKPCENQEFINLQENIIDCFIHESNLYIITINKLIFYEILDLRRYVICNPIDEVFSYLKNLDTRESLALYFELRSIDADISKLDYLLVKIDENHTKGLFSFVYRQLKQFLNVEIYEILENDDIKAELDKVVKKFKNLIINLNQPEFNSGVKLMDFVIQSIVYAKLLFEFRVDLQHITLYKLVIEDDTEFKKKTLNTLMEIHRTNQNLDTLVTYLSNKASDFLPLEDLYYYKGFDALKKYPSKDKLWEALRNFKNIPFNIDILEKFNELKFYVGSTILIKKHYNYNHEETVRLLKNAIKCNGAISQCLEDKREDFLYAFFDALIDNLINEEINTFCVCCEATTRLKLSEIIKIESTFLYKYLKEKMELNSNPLVYELHWKYCAYRDNRVDAVKSLLYLIDHKSLLLEKRIDLLYKAKTVSLHTQYQEQLKKRCMLLEIQKECLKRGEDSKAIKISLLTSDVLLNDHAYKYPDLALKVIDLSSFHDKFIIKSFLEEGMGDSFMSSLSFLKKHNFTGSVLDCDIIGELLLEKMSKDDTLSEALFEIGFSYYEIQKFVENKVKKENDEEFRNWLLEDFRMCNNSKRYKNQVEQICFSKN